MNMLRLRRRTARALVACSLAATISAAALVSPANAAPATYTVVRGDSISLIAMKMKVKMRDLMAANDLSIDSMLYPGDVLQVPAGGVVPSAPGAAQPATYTVVWGDSLIGIARTLKVSLRDLLTLNKLSTSSFIYPGMKLKVPGSVSEASTATTAAPAAAPAGFYVVVAGDYLARIAKVTRVSLTALLTANNLTLTSVIYPGDRLVIPAGGVVPGATAPTTTPTTTPTPAPAPAPTTTPTTAAPAPAPSSPIEKVLAFARAQIGKPYQFNTAGPATYDCSGLTLAAYATIGISLPHYSGAQATLGARVDWAASGIRPGDLVFLETSVGSGVIGHVGIAISGTEWIQAPRTGEFVKSSTIPMYRVIAVRRFVNT